jgi:hypothetical protein
MRAAGNPSEKFLHPESVYYLKLWWSSSLQWYGGRIFSGYLIIWKAHRFMDAHVFGESGLDGSERTHCGGRHSIMRARETWRFSSVNGNRRAIGLWNSCGLVSGADEHCRSPLSSWSYQTYFAGSANWQICRWKQSADDSEATICLLARITDSSSPACSNYYSAPLSRLWVSPSTGFVVCLSLVEHQHIRVYSICKNSLVVTLPLCCLHIPLGQKWIFGLSEVNDFLFCKPFSTFRNVSKYCYGWRSFPWWLNFKEFSIFESSLVLLVDGSSNFGVWSRVKSAYRDPWFRSLGYCLPNPGFPSEIGHPWPAISHLDL